MTLIENLVHLIRVISGHICEDFIFIFPFQLDKLASCLAFLHRNGMPVIIVHGWDGHVDIHNTSRRQRRAKLVADNIELVDLLEKHGSRARPFMGSGHVISVFELENHR